MQLLSLTLDSWIGKSGGAGDAGMESGVKRIRRGGEQKEEDDDLRETERSTKDKR